MRINIFLLWCVLLSQITFAQDIIVHYGGNTYHSIFISKDFNQYKDNFCDKSYGFGHVCYQQEGLLYTTSNYLTRLGNTIVPALDLKFVNLINCDTNLVTGTLDVFRGGFTGFFVDYLGRIYFQTEIKQSKKKALCRSNNKFNNITILRYLNDLSEPLLHDIVFLRNEVIALNYNNNLLYVMDTNFNIIKTVQPNIKITRLTSQFVNCNNRRLIVSGYPYSLAVWDSIEQYSDNKLNDTLYLFDYDYKVDTFKLLGKHVYAHTGKATIPSLTSFDDILSSDPECEFLLDLDRNNSSGAYPYDYRYPRRICARDSIPITDDDLYLESDLLVDSLQITISSLKDSPEEEIVFNDPSYLNYLIKRNDSLYSIVLPNSINAQQILDIIKSIRYIHNGIFKRTEGERSLKIRVFAEGQVSRQAICTLSISTLNLFVRDTFICYNDSILGNNRMTYYSGDTMLHFAGSDYSGCDSIEVLNIKSYKKEDIQVTGDSIICYDSENELCISGGSRFLWYSGENSACINVNDSGHYNAKVYDENNCLYNVSIDVYRPEPIQYAVEINPPVCFGDRDGRISIHTKDNIIEYLIGSERNTSGRFEGLEAGTHVLGFYDKYLCFYLDTLVIPKPTEISIQYQDTIVVKDRIPELLSILDQNNTISKIVIQPYEGIRMTGNWKFELNPEQGGQYRIITTDSNGCTKQYSLVVILDLNYNVFYPNIFSPNNDGANDEWNITLGSGYGAISLEIFDRWGNRVYYMNKDMIGLRDKGWNGTTNGINCIPGVYVFKLTLKNDKNQIKNIAGTINLVR